jgi:hypothetical protein
MENTQRMRDHHIATLGLLGAAALLLLGGAAPAASAAHQPDFGVNVYIFNPRLPLRQIQAVVDQVARRQTPNQFGSERYALLFEPGTYGSAARPLNFEVGYYTSVAGLGADPRQVVINGSVQVHNQCLKGACGALDNFWRSLSNLTIHAPTQDTGCDSGEMWAVSQAAPIRRMRIVGDLKLTDTCTRPSYASGGFIADSEIEGRVLNGSQQQFMVRNSALQSWSKGSWNQVFSGVVGAPPECFPATPSCGPYTTLAKSPVTREAPFLYMDSHRRYQVFVPQVQRETAGTTWTGGTTSGKSLPIADVYVATPSDSAAAINSALSMGKHLILSPGVYRLDQSIRVTRADTVVLGLGFPTLMPQNGVIPMTVASPKGVSISGILFDAGETNSPALLVVGDEGAGAVDEAFDPTALHDVFFRIGGAHRGKATMSLIVNSSHVILDDIWAWRADHGSDVGWADNTADTGVIVNGDQTIAYGLFVEHYQKDEVIWNGDNGTLVFLQNEMPYDPPSQAAWREAPEVGWPAFKMGNRVTRFRGYGMGSYSYFNRGVPIHAANAFSVPSTLAPGSLRNLFTIYLDSGSGGILNVINNQGGSYTPEQPHAPVTVTSYP